MQSILTFLPLMILIVIIGMILFLGIISLLLWLAMLIFWIILIIKTFQGEKFLVHVTVEMVEIQINNFFHSP